MPCCTLPCCIWPYCTRAAGAINRSSPPAAGIPAPLYLLLYPLLMMVLLQLHCSFSIAPPAADGVPAPLQLPLALLNYQLQLPLELLPVSCTAAAT
eukprot:1160378-Pelagomonas_calceolata.AAC.6